MSPCRRFPDQESPPTALELPGLPAPKRKAGTQELLAVLAGCGGSQIFTACLLFFGRKSPPSFVPAGSRPCRPSADPQARPPLSSCRQLSEPPAIPSTRRSPRHFAVAFRGYAATHARKTPCHIETTINNPTTNQDSYTQDCLILRFTSDQPGKVCAMRTSVFSHPWSYVELNITQVMWSAELC